MKEPAYPADETKRLRSLQRLRILDTQAEERFDRVTRLAQRIFGVPIALVSLVDADRQWFKSRQGLDACETGRGISFCGHAVLGDEPLVVPDALADPRFADNPLVLEEPKIRFYAGHPVHGPEGARVGTLCVIDRQPRDLSADDLAMLGELAAMVDHEFSLISQTTTDELTRISNRRGFMQIAEYILPLCRRTKRSATLAAIDLDGFKTINDTYGHDAGDDVLRGFARLLIKQFRDSDVVARLGGDEFCVLSSGATAQQIAGPLERLRIAFADTPMAKSYPRLSWSCGVAESDPAATVDIEELMRVADSQMYEMKQQGKRLAAASGFGK